MTRCSIAGCMHRLWHATYLRRHVYELGGHGHVLACTVFILNAVLGIVCHFTQLKNSHRNQEQQKKVKIELERFVPGRCMLSDGPPAVAEGLGPAAEHLVPWGLLDTCLHPRAFLQRTRAGPSCTCKEHYFIMPNSRIQRLFVCGMCVRPASLRNCSRKTRQQCSKT